MSAPPRYAKASFDCGAWRSLIAQMPRYVNAEEPAIEPARLTASTGRRAGSTSPPQIRRNRRENSLIGEWCARQEPERRLDRRADQRREHHGTEADDPSQEESGRKNGDFDQGAD